MGFKEEIKVHLSTRSASVTEGFSKATWHIKDPVRPPNPLYKMKLQVSNAIIPNTFDKISADRGNNKMVLVYYDESVPMDPVHAIKNNNYIQFVLIHYENPVLEEIYDYLRSYFKDAIHNLFPGQNVKPIIGRSDIAGRTRLRIEMPDWNDKDDLWDPVPGSLQLNMTYEILTVGSLKRYGITDLQPEDVALANVLGFDDSRVWRTDTESRAWLQANANPNFSGTQFIKLMSNMNINNIDPNTLTFSRVLGIIPITDQEEEMKVVYMAGGLQSPQFQTIGDPELKIIELELKDDQDRPLNVHGHWYVELCVVFEEEEKTDMYRGLSALTGPAANVDTYDPSGYARIGSELTLKRRLDEMRDVETDGREDNFLVSTGKRRFM